MSAFDADYHATEPQTATKERPAFDEPPNQLVPALALGHANGGNEYADLVEVIDRTPRNTQQLLAEARSVGAMLAKDGFYRWVAGKDVVEGPSIDLAYALAQTWGRNVTRCKMISIDGDRAHLRGQYIDLLTMTVTERDYYAHLAPPPGKYKKDPVQSDRWRVMQLQMAVSKAVRGAILGGLPAWYVDAAFRAAVDEDARKVSGGKPLPELRKDAVAFFAKHGVSVADLEAWLDRPMDTWAVPELGELREQAQRISKGLTSATELLRAAAPATPPPENKDALGLKRERRPRSAKREDAPAEEPEARPMAAPVSQVLDSTRREQMRIAVRGLEAELGSEVWLAAREAKGISPTAAYSQLSDAQLDSYLTQLRSVEAAMRGEDVEP